MKEKVTCYLYRIWMSNNDSPTAEVSSVISFGTDHVDALENEVNSSFDYQSHRLVVVEYSAHPYLVDKELYESRMIPDRAEKWRKISEQTNDDCSTQVHEKNRPHRVFPFNRSSEFFQKHAKLRQEKGIKANFIDYTQDIIEWP